MAYNANVFRTTSLYLDLFQDQQYYCDINNLPLYLSPELSSGVVITLSSSGGASGGICLDGSSEDNKYLSTTKPHKNYIFSTSS